MIVGNAANTANGTMDIYLEGVHVTASQVPVVKRSRTVEHLPFLPIWGGIGDRVTIHRPSTGHVYLAGSKQH